MHQPIASLQLPDHQIQDLELLGYNYCKDFNVENPSVSKIITSSEWDNVTNVPKTKTALDCYQEECIAGSVITLYKELDEVLGGGIPIGLITELCGEPGSGKTQICFQLAVNVQLPIWCGGVAGKALYISTNKGFASHRYKEIAVASVNHYTSIKNNHFKNKKVQSNEFEVNSILKRTYHFSAVDHIELLAVVKYLRTWLKEHSPVRLVVIDSITTPLKQLNGWERTQAIYNIFNDLRELAEVYGFATVITNDMTTRIDTNNFVYHTPSLGGSYYHNTNLRIQLSKKSGNEIQATVVKNVLESSKTVEFKLFC